MNVFVQNLLSDVEAHQPQLDSLVAAGQALESEAGDSGLSDMEYGSAQDRYDKLKVLIKSAALSGFVWYPRAQVPLHTYVDACSIRYVILFSVKVFLSFCCITMFIESD